MALYPSSHTLGLVHLQEERQIKRVKPMVQQLLSSEGKCGQPQWHVLHNSLPSSRSNLNNSSNRCRKGSHNSSRGRLLLRLNSRHNSKHRLQLHLRDSVNPRMKEEMCKEIRRR